VITTVTDDVAPVTGTVANNGSTNDTTPTLTGTAEAGSTVSLYDGATLLGTVVATGGTWTFTPTLAQGSHTLTATATDAAGNVSTASSSFTVIEDTAAPSAPSISSVTDNAGTIQGTLSSEGYTDDNTLTLSGNAEAGATIKIYNNGTLVGSATADGSGNWTATTDALSDGAASLTATATDAAGNVSGLSGPFTTNVDTLAPGTPSISTVTDDVPTLIDGEEVGTGDLTSGVSTNDTNLTVTVSLAGTGAVAGDTIRLYNGTDTGSPLGSAILTDADVTAGSVTLQTGTLASTGTYSLTVRVIDQVGNTSVASTIFTIIENPNAVCFARGSRILTASGEVAVEAWRLGDLVITADGNTAPITWIGQRNINIEAHPRPATVAPVRIQRHAFADNQPHTDLLVSPDHALFVDGTLIAARQLINGTTIRQEANWKSVEYFHVELDRHAILLAEGLPAESYLDTGNRGFFANGGAPLVLHPDLTDESDCPTREAASCAPFAWDEATVRPVWQRLAERATTLGQPVLSPETTTDPDLHLVIKGRTVRPLYAKDGLFIFALLPGTSEARLVSRSASPTDTRPWMEDRRLLGVHVQQIVLRDTAEVTVIALDNPALSQGWWDVERDGPAMRRWTNGDALLPLPRMQGASMLEIRAGALDYVISSDHRAAA
jgi:hypothetical protein